MMVFARVKCEDRCSSSLALPLSLEGMDCFFGCFFGRSRENTSLLCLLIFFFGFLQTKNMEEFCVFLPPLPPFSPLLSLSLSFERMKKAQLFDALFIYFLICETHTHTHTQRVVVFAIYYTIVKE